ncbi:MAG: hypothetical protein EPN14_10380 [Gallionella sp.]|nr:MAG: hypothetical protein EPN14_10380 [Gallionella sp.]
MKMGILVAALMAISAQAACAASEPIQPVPAASVKNKAMVEPGKNLFLDPRLSKSGFFQAADSAAVHGQNTASRAVRVIERNRQGRPAPII